MSYVRLRLFVALVLCLALTGSAFAQTAGKPLTEKDLTSLIELGIDDDAVVARIKKGGVEFKPDDAALGRLKKAGASDAVLKALQEAAKKEPASPPADAITYEQVLQLLQLRIDEDAILSRLAKSPTIFTLDARQTEALKQAGASEKLLAAMAGQRPAPAQGGDITDVAIILDCSGSMRESTKDGQAKMTVAKRVVADLINKIPDGLNVTFVIYGHEVYGNAQDPRNCQAVKVARPLSPLDASGKAQLSRIIAGLQPTGATPIALSLRTAGQELAKNNALCGLVLITDGLETCQGDPAAEAARLLADLKLSFGVNVVGFDVKPEESRALQTIADAGKGKYYNAASAEELAEKMSAVAMEIAASAKPPEKVVSNRRAVKILPPGIDMPAMQEVFLAEAGQNPVVVRNNVKARINAYSDEIRIPSATAKYDIWWMPREGEYVRMVKDFSLSERRVVEIKPEDYLGLVRVGGRGMVDRIIAVPAGTNAFVRGNAVVQRAAKFGAVMALPAGKYDICVDDDVIEEGLEVEPGKLYELE